MNTTEYTYAPLSGLLLDVALIQSVNSVQKYKVCKVATGITLYTVLPLSVERAYSDYNEDNIVRAESRDQW